ncbi:hypothetical protein N7504_004980 [Penicillium tannophilum]|nr:hypothetical protein N7504_004980 [Penicillium tannophilum]
MSFTPKERKKVEKLRRKYRIEFDGEGAPQEWPNSHRSTFSAVQRLGKTQFDNYAACATTIENAPWAADTKNHAEKLSERAKRCVRRNESTWRFACEPYALARLTSDVACCVGREYGAQKLKRRVRGIRLKQKPYVLDKENENHVAVRET